MAKKKQVKPRQDDDFPIVGIGASAGGLEAIEGLFAHFPANPGLGFVIIQHLDPKHPSMMASLLQKHAKMPVVQIRDGMKVEANNIYLNPPDNDVTIEKRTLHLAPPVPARGPHLPIDHFFRTLATDLAEKAICIVLSGTGSDGSWGLKAVKGEGGITLAQKAEQAKYSGMPQSAIDTGFVDLILPVEEIPKELLKYAKHPYLQEPTEKLSEAQKFTASIARIFLLIRESSGVDFTNYKPNTIRRRIQRRMALHQIELPEDYVKFLREHREEIDLLYKDLLIKVTSFFRDPDAFKVLEEEVIPQIIAHKMPGSAIRVWVPACASGEEAFSIAMLFLEAFDRSKKSLELHVFATDIDLDAINTGRQAVYADNIAADVSSDRLERFFTRADGQYKVKKTIREMVVFAAQNVIKDPPFSKLDLISCRNMLIYMDSTLQKKLLPMFHYVLNPEGFLFLGSSESVGDFADLYSPINLKWKLFKRKGVAITRRPEFAEAGLAETAELTRAREQAQPREQNIKRLAETVILENYAPTCVLVDRTHNILYVNGHTDHFLSLPAGEPTYNIIKMARDEVRIRLSTLLHKAFKEKKEVRAEGLPVKMNGFVGTFNLIVRPIAVAGSEGEMAMVIFETKKSAAKPAAVAKKKKGKAAPADVREQQLEQELASTKEYLQTTVEELETSNEELKSTNEELQSTNEELQSTNEELETSREELQSTNEELETVNTELQNKVSEMSQISSDSTNLLNAMNINALFLDADLRIRRFTSAISRIFKLIDTDIGRPIDDIATMIKKPGLYDNIRQVLASFTPTEEEVETADGNWFLMRIRPYKTIENVIDGAVVTFIDITGRRKAELEATEAQHFAESIIATMREPLLVLDEQLRVIIANESFYFFFKVKRENTEGRFVYELGNGQWDIARLRELLENVLPKNKQFDDFEVEYDFPLIGKKRMFLNARQIFAEQEGKQQILLAFEDVTQK